MPIISKQLRLSTEFAESSAYHSSGNFGFFTIAQKVDGPRTWQQKSYRLDRLPDVLESLAGQPDTYISQAAFAAPNRRLASFASVRVLWVDLDYYSIERLRGFSAENVAWQVREACAELSLPPPSVIVDSGRGLYLKWFLDAAIPKRALPRWQLVQNTFCLKLRHFGADPNARDAARVLRLVGSTHKKSGRPVAVIWHNTTPTHGAGMVDGVVTYSFDMLADEQLPLTRERLNELRAERELEKLERASRQTSTGNSLVLIDTRDTSGLKPFVPSQLAWDRYNDILKLMELRGWASGAPEGKRDMPLFLCAALISQAVVVPQLADEISVIAKKIAPTWTAVEIRNCVASVVARADAALRGEKLDYNGRQVDPRYIFRTDTLLSLLEVTPSEEAQLTTIIGKTEARRRDADRARRARAAAGACPRQSYESAAADRRSQAVALRAAGQTWAEVGQTIGVSATAARLLASRAETKRSSPSVYM